MEDRHTSVRGDNTASFPSHVDTHLHSPDWVPDRPVRLNLKQTTYIFKCSGQQGAFSVTGRHEQNASGSGKVTRTGQMLRFARRMVFATITSILSLPPTVPQYTLLVICESQDAFHCVPWLSPPQTGMVSARTTQTVVSQLSACWVVSTTPTNTQERNE